MEEGIDSGLPTEPPPLPYSLHTRKKAIAFFWFLFVFDTLGQPLILYWVLTYCTNLSANLVFSIVTACLGGVSVFEYFYRLHNLFRKNSRARPLNARKSWLDFFHINFTIVWLILAVELIIGTVPKQPYVRLVAMVLPTVMFYFGFVHLTLDVLRMMGFKAPFRISSTPKGSVMPTALYALIEDVVAVDGGGGQMYRYALRTRYLSSPYFRRMLFEMNCFWSGGSIIFAAAITVVIFTVSEPVAFTLGWSLPFAWAGVWTLITIPWVQSDLRREKKAWAENRGQGGIRWADDITAPTRTRFESVQEYIPSLLPWVREKQAGPSTPSADCADEVAHKSESVPDSVPDGVSDGNSGDPHSTLSVDGTPCRSTDIPENAAASVTDNPPPDDKN
ncbi:uncharacterized protein N7482_006669 [Penicillium canariense]|uniref:Uncharacterized protein n=1 Tax=Penicillium canariense TaxID=189055 RepID=A0A9W9LJ61_9EURO|nr:uncharacterized protein N7482_006669 [Penicillium canariense]KAJ5159665.1 hypothetical protein N7482_006669 [Penicillium canariense]